MELNQQQPVIFFDDQCGLCRGSVAWIRRLDKRRQFQYIPVSKAADVGVKLPDIDSMVLLNGGKQYVRSGAVFQICRLMGWPWKLAFVLSGVIPPSWADAVYDRIAAHRNRLGSKGQCSTP